jgi:hypothetical protein
MNVITSRKQASKGFFLLNVGLDVGTLKNVLLPSTIKAEFDRLGLGVVAISTLPATAKSEATASVAVYVRALNAPTFLDDLASASKSLGQDCIAAYHPLLNEGFLVGPNAAAFGGVFDAAYFRVDAATTLADLPEPLSYFPSRTTV